MASHSTPHNYTALVKKTALELGFMYCGIAKATFLEEEAPRLEKWLKEDKHGKMDYMANHFDKRLDPTKLVPGAKSVVSLAYNYFPKNDLAKKGGFKIAKYAYGKDYHYVIKSKLKAFLQVLTEHVGEIQGRAFVDSAPVMERQWAQKSGLGWTGKNTLLLNKQRGSFFFLAELITDLPLVEDGPVKDYCGTCSACIDACPTDAIVAPYSLDASRCISYLTIELKEQIPSAFKGQFDHWIFGCDICQDVCPWNRFSQPHSEPAFNPSDSLTHFDRSDWMELTEDLFQTLFKKSPVKRTKFSGLKRNISFCMA